MVKLFYTTYISVEFVHHGIFRAKAGKGGIKGSIIFSTVYQHKSCTSYDQYLKTKFQISGQNTM